MTATATGRAAPAADPGSVRGAALRVALAAVALAAVAVSLAGAPRLAAVGFVSFLMVVAAIGTALAPGSLLPAALAIGVVCFRLAGHGAVDIPLMVLVALLPAIHQLAGLAAVIPPRSRCRWSALGPAGRRYAIAVVPVEIALGVVILAG